MRLSEKVLDIQESFLNKWDSTVKNEISRGENILQFNLGQPDFACPDFVKNIIAGTKDKERNNFYNHTGGTDRARDAIAMFQKKVFGLKYTKEEVIVTNGAKEALFLSLAAILNADDEVVIIAPYWPSYIEMVKFLGGVPIVVNTRQNFYPDVEGIKKAVSEKTKAIIINNPNNPTGVVYGKKELSDIASLAVENDLVVIADEVYNCTIFDNVRHTSIASFPGMRERTVIIDSFSKMLSMAGYRLGYAMSSKEMIDDMIKIKSNINGNTNSFFQIVLEEVILNHFDELVGFIDSTTNEYKARRDFVCEKLADMKVDFIRPDGTFYIFAKIPEKMNMKSQEFAKELLEKTGVAVAPGIFFGKDFDDHFRISFGASMESLEEGMKRMGKFLRQGL